MSTAHAARLFVFAAAWSAGCIGAQGTRDYCAFEVSVSTPKGVPVRGVLVSEFRQNGSTFMSSTTDENGVARICDAPQGSDGVHLRQEAIDIFPDPAAKAELEELQHITRWGDWIYRVGSSYGRLHELQNSPALKRFIPGAVNIRQEVADGSIIVVNATPSDHSSRDASAAFCGLLLSEFTRAEGEYYSVHIQSMNEDELKQEWVKTAEKCNNWRGNSRSGLVFMWIGVFGFGVGKLGHAYALAFAGASVQIGALIFDFTWVFPQWKKGVNKLAELTTKITGEVYDDII